MFHRVYKEKIYNFRVSNVGISTSINFRIQGHMMTLVKLEGSHTLQEVYESLDIHVGQSVTVLVMTDVNIRPSRPLPIGPTYHIHWSMKQTK